MTHGVEEMPCRPFAKNFCRNVAQAAASEKFQTADERRSEKNPHAIPQSVSMPVHPWFIPVLAIGRCVSAGRRRSSFQLEPIPVASIGVFHRYGSV